MTEIFESSKRALLTQSPNLSEFVLNGPRASGNDSSVQRRREQSKALDDFLSLNTPEVSTQPKAATPEAIKPDATKPEATTPKDTTKPLPPLIKRADNVPTKPEISDSFIVPKSPELTASSLHQYLSDNFDTFDKDRDGKIHSSEIPIRGNFENKNVEKFNKFAHTNYYALRNLSNDDDGREQGITRKDIAALLGPRPDSAPADLATSFAEAALDHGGLFVAGSLVGLYKGVWTGNWKAALISSALGGASSVARGSIDLMGQSSKVDSLYFPEDPTFLWKR